MFLEKDGNSGHYINLNNVLFVLGDKKTRIRFELINERIVTGEYPNVSKAQEDIDIIERIIKKNIYFDE